MSRITKLSEKREENKGITLIALVITIIILLMLAGITIATLTGENGLLEKAKDAKIKTEIESIKEEIRTKILGKQAENEGNISDVSLTEILDKYGDLSGEEKLIDKTLTTTKGSYKIKVSDIFSGTTIKDVPENPTIAKVANEPNISGFNKNNTYYVAWNLESSSYVINDGTAISGTAPENWYDYTEGQNKWANIKTTGGGNDCYWVWIPRYAYQVPTKGDTAETIEVKFLQGSTNIPIGETTEITKTIATPGRWVVHPAFTNEGNGGFGELTGIWVAKYEASSSVATDLTDLTIEQIASAIANDGGSSADVDLKVRVKPNVTSWRNISVGNIFQVCRNLTQSGNSLENTSNLNSHMIKNTEWGAVAYLSRSVYGKNGEVWNNPYYNNTTHFSSITGLCSNEIDGKDKSTTDLTKTYKYNEVDGGNASTTGNVYGVYDMAGGAWEFVAGYLNEVTVTSNYATLANEEDKYSDKYAGTSSNRIVNYNANTAKYGEAVYETSSSGFSNTGSWDASFSYFLDSSYPVFKRGGHAYDGSIAGVFAFTNEAGAAYVSLSFRPVVLSSQP